MCVLNFMWVSDIFVISFNLESILIVVLRDATMADNNVNGGYAASFCMELNDDYVCSICMLAFRNPQQIEGCGHQFCQSCLDEYKRT